MRKFILMGLLTATTSFLLIISCGTTENAASAPVPGIDKVINGAEAPFTAIVGDQLMI